MSRTACRFLRPYLCQSFTPRTRPEHAQVYRAVQRRLAQSAALDAHASPPSTHDVERRIAQLRNTKPLREYHPRLVEKPGITRLSPKDFIDRYSETRELREDIKVEVFGRVRSVRLAGSKLIFVDIERQHQKLQVLCNFRILSNNGVNSDQYKGLKQILRRGDWISITGHPTRSTTQELSILAVELPEILSPSLHQLPETIEDTETLTRYPHVHQLISRQPGDILRLRACVSQSVREFLVQDGFMEVETPMFNVGAGGAIARPFETVANEMSNTSLRLRIAPELFLKRLIVGGNEKVFELGRVFRNEGVDTTHNPEFTICEFYEVGATLEKLISRTERLFQHVAALIEERREHEFPSISTPNIDFRSPFQRVPFIPTIEEALGCNLPNLSSPNAAADLSVLFSDMGIALPINPTLPRLLDILAQTYIEPLCEQPTFVINHPEALSPLSKSFVDPISGQRVAARVELFINGREFVNAYEEENSPFEQREKFEKQLSYQEGRAEADFGVDVSYVEALEWGMPPTGGWGCGMDRLVMLFSGAKRIADVLPFGTLRNVVAIAKNGQKP